MYNPFRILLCLIFLTCGVIAPVAPRAKTQDQLVDKIAAVVGTQIILLSEVLKQAEPALKEIDKVAQGDRGMAGLMGGKKSAVLKETLNRMVDDEIFLIEAREMELTVTQEELDAAVENMARENNVDIPTLKQAIEQQGMDYLTYRNQLRRQLTRYKVLNLRVRSRIKITDAEARQHPARVGGRTVGVDQLAPRQALQRLVERR